MGKDRETTEIFGKCYRLMHRVGAGMGDEFFAGLWSRESDSLLSDFIVFLKVKGEMLAQVVTQLSLGKKQNSESKVESATSESIGSETFMRHGFANWQSRVAQCRKKINDRIERILELLEILKHTAQTTGTTPLLLERELLRFRLAVLDSSGAGAPTVRRTASDKSTKTADSEKQKSSSQTEIKLDQTHKQILQFIKSKTANGGEVDKKVQNTEVFTHFPDIHRRTLKRKLSDLAAAGSLRRAQKGKSVYYVLPTGVV